MKLPQLLLKIAEGIAVDLPKDKQKDFLETVKQAADRKDISVVHWQFLGAELRELPKKLPKNIQSIVDEMCAGMDRLAAGEQWHDTSPTFDKVDDMLHKEWVCVAPHAIKTIHALKNTADSIRAVDENTEAVYAAAGYAICTVSSAACSAAYNASYDVETGKAAQADEDFYELAIQAATEKAAIAYVAARRRQRDTLLEIIENAKPIKGKIMANKRGHHRKTEQARNAARIREIIKNNPYAKPKDIIEATGLHPSTVSRHLKALRQQAEQGEEAGK